MRAVRSKDAELTPELHAYIVERAGGRDDLLRQVEDETSELGGVAIMQTSAEQAALLEMLARVSGARRAIEVGTFTGYGAIRIARGLAPDGTLLCCEIDEHWAEVARANIERAGLADRVEVRLGPALDDAALPCRPTRASTWPTWTPTRWATPTTTRSWCPGWRPAASWQSTTCS